MERWIYRTAASDDARAAASLLATVTGTAFVDAESPACVYQLVAVDRHGNESAPARVTVTGGRALEPAGVFDLASPSPNPARNATALVFALPRADRVALEIFDLGGRRIRTWSFASAGAGGHRLDWDLRDDGGRPVGPGIYCVRLTAAGASRTRRLAIVR